MITVITGDIIKSSEMDTESWLSPLKQALAIIQPQSHLREIYRGDSFQLELQDNLKAFESAIYIKAAVKMIKGLDVRIAIGMGDKTYDGERVTESNGPAFQYSGETFEELKREKQNLKIKTAHSEFDELFNLYFLLLLMKIDHWTVNAAEVVKLRLEYPKMRQKDMARHIGISQNTISERMKRANFSEIMALNAMFRKKIKVLQ